jgi:acyl-CoA reductase-like NAD-dependent aldehyde dehydrogenase
LIPVLIICIRFSATGKLLTKVAAATEKDVDIAVEAARKVIYISY